MVCRFYFGEVTATFILAVAVVSIGAGGIFGFNIGVINNPERHIKSWMKGVTGAGEKELDIFMGLVGALYPLGALFGGALTSVICRAFGRKGGLTFNCAIAVIGGLLFDFCKQAEAIFMLFLGRFVVGVNTGLNAGLAPVYLSEIPPTKIRGAVGSLFQLNITIFILVAQFLGHENVMGTDELWPYVLGLVSILAVIEFILLLFCPESPKHYLESKNDEEKAKEACQKLLGDNFQEQFNELKGDIEESKKMPDVTMKQMLSERKLRKPLILICGLMTAQQLSGINAVMFYSTAIFAMANFSGSAAQMSTIGVGVVNVLMTVVSVWLVEKSGRKPLLLIAFAGMVVTTFLLLITLYFVEQSSFMGYLAIVEVYVYVIFFAAGAGSIPWLLGPELFNTAARPLAVSFAVPTNWAWAFIVTLAFPPLQGALGPAVFIIFVVCNALAFLFVWIFCPETKNRTIEEITASF